jgi:hypothetical protein
VSRYPSLKWINVFRLAATAGDPWAIDESLRSGDPGAIAELGRAFVAAAACTAETYQEFARAQARFRASWNRENGSHPINDSAEVQHATTALFVQKEQLPAIGAVLSDVAADLAAAQRFCHSTVENLNNELRYLDALVDHALAEDEDTSELEASAVAMTANAFRDVERLREDYAGKLTGASTYLRHELGYDPDAIDALDGDGPTTPEQRGRESTEWYDANRRAKDQALVDDPAGPSAAKSEAAARLRDYSLTTDPAADDAARHGAEQRLDDFRMAGFVGPLAYDPLLGGTARDRARIRLDLQRRLEQGLGEIPPMSSDEATRILNDGEQFGRVVATRRAIDGLRRVGMSEEGAWRAVSEFLHEGAGTGRHIGHAEEALKAYAEQPPGGWASRVTAILSPEDAAKFSVVAKRLGVAGNLLELTTATIDKANGGSWADLCSSAGGVVGGAATGWWAAGSLALLAPAMVTPPTAALAVVAAGVLGGLAGSEVGGAVCAEFDPAPAAPIGRG